jgi:hypothetical protein
MRLAALLQCLLVFEVQLALVLFRRLAQTMLLT